MRYIIGCIYQCHITKYDMYKIYLLVKLAVWTYFVGIYLCINSAFHKICIFFPTMNKKLNTTIYKNAKRLNVILSTTVKRKYSQQSVSLFMSRPSLESMK